MTASTFEAGQHRPLGGSSAERWINCPGSVKASKGVEKVVSEYMTEGTAAHTVLSAQLAGDQVGPTVEADGKDVPVTDEMIAAVDVAVSFIREKAQGATVWNEIALDMSSIDPRMGGTADLVIARPESDVQPGFLGVYDYKHGAGTIVDVENNAQLLFYATGVWLKHHDSLAKHGITEVELGIIQPRAYSGGKIKTDTVSLMEILDFEQELREAVRRIDETPDKRIAGPWCKWCPVGATCEARAKLVNNVTIMPYKYAETGDPDLIALKVALDQREFVRSWLEDVSAYADKLAISDGVKIPGWKVVQGKAGARQWADGGKGMIGVLTELGLKPAQAVTEPVVISPTQAAKLLPTQMEVLNQYITQPLGKKVLVPESDKRPEASAALKFDDLDSL